MIRKGRFAVVDGKEYRLRSAAHKFYLISNNPDDCHYGFQRLRDENQFYKEVCLSKIDQAYEVFPYVMLCSYRFTVESIDLETRLVTLVTSNPFVQKKIAVKPYHAGQFMIEIPLDELQIREERIAILGFNDEKFQLFS